MSDAERGPFVVRILDGELTGAEITVVVDGVKLRGSPDSFRKLIKRLNDAVEYYEQLDKKTEPLTVRGDG